MTVAYLNSEYPSLSHTFIEREIRGLRERGVEIRTYSVRSATGQGRIGSANRAAAEETVVLQAGWGTLLRDLVAGAVQSPAGLLRAIAASQRLSPPGIGYRLRHMAYVMQGVRLARSLGAAGIRHVHVHMANNGAAIAMMACAFDPRLSYSLSIHGSAEFFHVDTWTLKEKAEAAVFVRCISEFCRAQVMAWTDPEVWGRFHIVHCGIDPAVYVPRPTERSGPLRILTVGRLHPIKGYDVLLDACGRLRRDGVEFELEMIGDGPMRPRLEAQVGALGLGGCVKIVGAVDQDRIGEHYDRADIMVISSFMEGVPVVLMEAMAKELGVVSTRVGGVPELVEDGATGFLVDPGSSASLADAIKRYATDLALCRLHGQRGRSWVLSKYNINHAATGMAALFNRQLASSATRSGGESFDVVDRAASPSNVNSISIQT